MIRRELCYHFYFDENLYFFITLITIYYILQGGIGDAVLDAVAETRNILVKKMCVKEVPRSGPPMVLLEKYGIGTDCIVKTVQEFSKVA